MYLANRKRTPPFFNLTYSWCTHFAATCSRPPGAAVPLALPSPSSATVCVQTRLGQQEGEEINMTRPRNLHRSKRSLRSSWLLLILLVPLSVSVGFYASAAHKFISSSSRKTWLDCVHNLSNYLNTPVYCTRWSFNSWTHTYFCGHAHYVRKQRTYLLSRPEY